MRIGVYISLVYKNFLHHIPKSISLPRIVFRSAQEEGDYARKGFICFLR
jgi:hypothetical protein